MRFQICGGGTMVIWHKLSLRTKINIILFLVLAAFLAVSLTWQYHQQRAFLFSEAIAKARIITAEATRTREYLSRQLKTGSVELNRDRYGLIPVVVANRIGQLVGEDLTYSIRHTSNRFRNRDNAPDVYEQAVLQRFSEEKGLDHVAEFTTMNDVPVFRYLKAAHVDESCLECHGDPEKSPQFLKDIYPPEQDASYHYQVGDVIGAVSIIIPMAPIEKQLATTFRNTLLTTSAFFVALVVCLSLILRRTVLNPLRNLTTTIGTVRTTGHFPKRLASDGQDEIGELVTAFNEMGKELGAKTAQLEESEKRFRLLVETARDAMIAFLPSGKIFLANRAAEEILGYSQEDLFGEQFDRLFVMERDVYGDSLTSFIAAAHEQWFRDVHVLSGLRRDQAQIRLEMMVNIVDTGERPFYTATLRPRAAEKK